MKLGLSESEGRREFALAEVQKEFSPNAEKNLQNVLEERPDDIEVLQALAEGYAQAERREEAERCYTRLLELAPDRLDFHLQRGQVRLPECPTPSRPPQAAPAPFRACFLPPPDP